MFTLEDVCRTKSIHLIYSSIIGLPFPIVEDNNLVLLYHGVESFVIAT